MIMVISFCWYMYAFTVTKIMDKIFILMLIWSFYYGLLALNGIYLQLKKNKDCIKVYVHKKIILWGFFAEQLW